MFSVWRPADFTGACVHVRLVWCRSDNQAMTSLVLLAALTTAPPQAACKPQFAPLTTGTHAGDSSQPFWRRKEAGDWGGDGWLGWTWSSGTLQPVRLIVTDRPNDDDHDEDQVTIESIPDVAFAVRCVPGLRAGRIQPTRVMNDSLDPKRALNIALGSRRYELRLESARTDLFDAQVVLTDGSRTQVLYAADGFADEPHFDIQWAGDLDRDGKLDLVVNLNRKYSVHPYRLILSSKASGSPLVGEAAVFTTGD